MNRPKFKSTDRASIVAMFRDSNGRGYVRTTSGMVWRNAPMRPWHNKSERRRVIRGRRENRAILAAHSASV